jgi:cell division protein ZapC
MLQAGKDWRWYACENRNRLVLFVESTQEALVMPYKFRQLTQSAIEGGAFSLEDAALYEQICHYLAAFNLWNDGEIAVIALHATAAKLQLKPVLAKSWFFKPYQGQTPSTEAIITLNSHKESGQFLIIECDGESSLCMCLEHQMKLDEHFTLTRFETIKVLNDRVNPILINQTQLKRA